MDERSAADSSPRDLQRELLTGREAAALLPGVSYATVMRWAREGRICSVQYVKGGRRLFYRTDVEALLEPHVEAEPQQLAPPTSPSAVSPGGAAPLPGQGLCCEGVA
ncbi:DNA-binding protein [Actinomyces lilanjuaniae]|uniref:DNA-binding protein n=2 Tax=Actinomyces lilanjuaniae TaxID=2321394 RepID=A0ABM6Z6M9_9ACTO|nr:helix-turn-helix domain-containing protein [Actinomyces lilanjuaniae]AYD90742.1 DNA-binding protein [Actinomyces lilanjuaniae]